MAAVSEKARKASVPVPGERTQGETIAYLLAMLTIGAVGFYLIKDLFAPAFFALTLVVTVRPLLSWMTRHHVPRVLAATTAILLIFTFVVLLFAALAVAVAQLVDTLPQYAPKFQAIWHQPERPLWRSDESLPVVEAASAPDGESGDSHGSDDFWGYSQ